MRSKLGSFFKPTPIPKATAPKIWFEHRLQESGLRKKISAEMLEKTQPSVKVFANRKYLPDTKAITDALTKVTAINVAGDKSGYFPNGLPFPKDAEFFAKIPEKHPELLSPKERLAASKKVIASQSQVFAAGGYPLINPIKLYPKPIKVNIFSLAGPTFETNYLHYSLFMLDHHIMSSLTHPYLLICITIYRLGLKMLKRSLMNSTSIKRCPVFE
ncbi:hypothetical protein [Legionella norrlandica]|uniref:hypothetical protein n=1 Tax=Legionella norrlandica TaxID=1498499 RepID=UPI000A75D2F2|nr:hypothetical protein [Legionella norrlandica]